MSDVVFRRIRGRIVPIKMTKGNKDALKGGVIAATGAAIAVGGASVYKRAVFKSASFAQKAFDAITPTPKQFSGIKSKFKSTAQMSFDDIVTGSSKVNSEKAFKIAKHLSRLSGAVRKASPIIGGALIVYGATKTAQAKSSKKLSAEKSAFIGAVGGGSLSHGIAQGKKLFEFGLNTRQYKFNFVKNSALELIKKYGKKAFENGF